ncbi:MAG TPA: hypothetical protein VMH30_11430 [Verrucomicrobiae bacterium]|nr:hypothetical protein [Verrucomicrobiae bacterium]
MIESERLKNELNSHTAFAQSNLRNVFLIKNENLFFGYLGGRGPEPLIVSRSFANVLRRVTNRCRCGNAFRHPEWTICAASVVDKHPDGRGGRIGGGSDGHIESY